MRKYILLLISFYTCVCAAQPIATTSFESFADETEFTKKSWESIGGLTVPFVDGFDQKRGYVDNAYSVTGSKSLRMFYPKGEYGTDNTGGQAPLVVTPKNELYSSYYVRFSTDFSWGEDKEGGKLPGLAGGGRCSGCKTCTGTNGFSARVMWRTGGAAVLYLYHMDKNQTCGDNIPLKGPDGKDFVFKKGKWYKISERVKVNTGNNKDGEVEFWIDNKPSLLVKGIRFVNNGDKVDALYFSTFHGGGDTLWEAANDSYAWFDDIVISDKKSDVVSEVVTATDAAVRSQIRLYPQPLTQGALLTIDGLTEETSDLVVHDVMGAEVYRKSVDMYSSTLILDAIPPGVYIVSIQSETNTFVSKVFIE